jgi:hypothetical protein
MPSALLHKRSQPHRVALLAALTKVKARSGKVMFTFPCLTNAMENMI